MAATECVPTVVLVATVLRYVHVSKRTQNAHLWTERARVLLDGQEKTARKNALKVDGVQTVPKSAFVLMEYVIQSLDSVEPALPGTLDLIVNSDVHRTFGEVIALRFVSLHLLTLFMLKICTVSAADAGACKRPDATIKRSNSGLCGRIDCGPGGWCDDGKCYCPAGKTGTRCKDVCPNGTWGVGCLQQCQCGPGGSCDAATGSCSCGVGLTGPTCSRPCPDGRTDFYYR